MSHRPRWPHRAACLSSWAEPAENWTSFSSAVLVPGTIAQPAAGTRIWARTMSNVEPLAGRRPVDRHADRRALLAADEGGDLVGLHAGDGLAVDLHEFVAGEHARTLRRPIADDRHDYDRALALAEDDADADHVAAQRVLLAGNLLGSQEDRVAGVAERLDQATNRAVGERPFRSSSPRPT